ncbi:hypothetical protein EDB92DRAFT_1430156 [Lactarius akahatsu]|uniref:CHAT domain-containing protein n=1 Tax=Lactarius akahatsu TaxID=416441 RepID=A0AAD4LR37_9AGAM|nr:hypothetical protein EDB92DRAFT_1430156 [Lactarius akahatsu]
MRSELPTAEFAFLSACHTAEMTEGSIVDEGLHLVAAVQYCGFRSVVGTMWAMSDVDGRDLAKHFYKALFSTSEGEQGDTFPFRFRTFELNEAHRALIPRVPQRAPLACGLSDSNPTRSQPQRPPTRSFAPRRRVRDRLRPPSGSFPGLCVAHCFRSRPRRARTRL